MAGFRSVVGTSVPSEAAQTPKEATGTCQLLETQHGGVAFYGKFLL